MKMLPKKPSEAMLEAGFDTLEARGFRVTGSDISKADLAAVFTAMANVVPTLTDSDALRIILQANIESRETRLGGTTNWAGDIWNALKRGVVK
jgi:hypothetical protein